MVRLLSFVLASSCVLSCGKSLDFSSTPYEPDARPWYHDADGDGFGNPLDSRSLEERPAGYVDNDLDCDDQNVDIHPNAAERCGGGDEDCDRLIDEADPDLVPDRTFWADPDGDGLGDPLAPRTACARPEGFVDNDDDCSPEPASVDWVDGLDDDCDGRVDVHGPALGTRWFSGEALHRHLRVGDTTLWLTSDVFLGLAPPEQSGAEMLVLRDEDIDLSQPQLLFDENVPLGSYGDIAQQGDFVWVRWANTLYRIDPTARGLVPLSAVAQQSVTTFDGFPLAIGDFDADSETEVASVMPLEGFSLCTYALGTENQLQLLSVEDRASLTAQDLQTARFSSDPGDDLVVSSVDGVYVLSPGHWNEPRLIYPYFAEGAVGDVDGDGLHDLALCTSERLEVWLGASFLRTPGEGWASPDVVTGQPCLDVALADVNGDGRDDLWIGESNRSVLALGSAVMPGLLEEGAWQLVLGEPTYSVSAGDIDGDGHADLGSRGPDGWLWLSGNP